MRVARGSGLRANRLAGRVRKVRHNALRSGPVGERATPTPGQDPQGTASRLTQRDRAEQNVRTADRDRDLSVKRSSSRRVVVADVERYRLPLLRREGQV